MAAAEPASPQLGLKTLRVQDGGRSPKGKSPLGKSPTARGGQTPSSPKKKGFAFAFGEEESDDGRDQVEWKKEHDW